MRQALERLAAALSGRARLPPLLDAALARLEASAWPEIVARWSRLTPSGFPVELDAGADGRTLRWAAEVAGPEHAESLRLARAATLLADNGEPPPAPLTARLRAVQARGGLRFGAWLGGRERQGAAARLKLYAELPAGTDLAGLGLPGSITAPLCRLPAGARPRMLGLEPARERVELYLRLPAVSPEDLLPFLHAAGHAGALAALQRRLPDGLRRLAGRRLGLSLACAGEGDPELALFLSARTMFPADPAMLAGLVPRVAALDPGHWRPGLVTLGLDTAGADVRATVGLVPRQQTR